LERLSRSVEEFKCNVHAFKRNEMKKFGYVLSGGGSRGFAHLGVIKFLEELGIKPYAIAGTSAGAIAGALYAAGKRPEEILDLFKESKLFGWSTLTREKTGFFSMDSLKTMLNEAVEKDDFAALKVKLFVASTDLVEGKSVIFSNGKLVEAVIASASVPVVFHAVKSGGKMLVDGGILNNFPVEPLSGICDVIIGSFVNKIEKGVSHNYFLESFNVLERCFHLAISNSAYSKVNNCDVFIEVPLSDFGMFDIKRANEIFDIGYNTALLHKEKLLQLKEDSCVTAIEKGIN
jgi:NTE family protein